MPDPRVVILGGGPAGVGAAWKLRKERKADVTLLEANPGFGGNSGGFEWAGQRLDYGSHRLHPATDADVMGDIQSLLGADLLDRPRHGRIRLLGKWIHFPLKPVDLFLRLEKSFALGSMRDMIAKALPGGPDEGNTFESVLRANLGRTICEHFYFPYAVKIWGHDPKELSGIQARRRVSASSFWKLMRKVFGQVPGLKKPGAGRFYFPRKGFGQISDGYAEAAIAEGADLRPNTRATRIERPEDGAPWRIHASTKDGNEEVFEADYLWSTIPITILAKALEPKAPTELLEAAERISYRSMILIYLQLPVDQFTEYDAHYFPDAKTRITRLSEPKNYAALSEPKGSTVICAELPCAMDDEVWSMDEESLGKIVAEDLAGAGLPLPADPKAVTARKLPQAYPIYLNGYEEPFNALDDWVGEIPRLLSYGRQGLFAHDNTHHALAMAYRASECLEGDDWNASRWAQAREHFKTHVVED